MSSEGAWEHEGLLAGLWGSSETISVNDHVSAVKCSVYIFTFTCEEKEAQRR